MADTHTKEQRRKNMQAIKAKSKLEDKVSAPYGTGGHDSEEMFHLFLVSQI